MAGRRLDEDHVGARLGIGVGALERLVEALDRDRVRAADQRHVALARVERGLDLADHLRLRHQRLVLEVAAALGHRLVLELHRRGARALEAADRALHVEGVAEARVDVDDHGDRRALADGGERVEHLARRGEADVGEAEARVADRRAGEIRRLEPRLLDEHGGKAVIDARGDDDAGLREALLERDHGVAGTSAGGRGAGCGKHASRVEARGVHARAAQAAGSRRASAAKPSGASISCVARSSPAARAAPQAGVASDRNFSSIAARG